MVSRMFDVVMKFVVFFVSVAIISVSATQGRQPDNFFAGSLCYAWPGGGLADSTAANPALGLSLGYLYRAWQHVHLGVRGTWTRMTLGETTLNNFTGYGLTHVGLYLNALYRPFKHGISPYLQIDGGMGYMFADESVANQPVPISGLAEVQSSVSASLGILIPVSDVMNADVSGRWFTTFVEREFSMVGVHAGIVYALR